MKSINTDINEEAEGARNRKDSHDDEEPDHSDSGPEDEK